MAEGGLSTADLADQLPKLATEFELRIVRRRKKLHRLISNPSTRTVLVECGIPIVTLAPEKKKLFGVLAEGLVSENSRGDKTPLELFLPAFGTGMRVCGADLVSEPQAKCDVTSRQRIAERARFQPFLFRCDAIRGNRTSFPATYLVGRLCQSFRGLNWKRTGTPSFEIMVPLSTAAHGASLVRPRMLKM